MQANSPPGTPSLRGKAPSKRGRKPRGASTGVGATPARGGSYDSTPTPSFASPQIPSVHWANQAGESSSAPKMLQLTPPAYQIAQKASTSQAGKQPPLNTANFDASEPRLALSPANLPTNPANIPGMISFDTESPRASPAPGLNMVMRGTPVLQLAPPGMGGKVDEEGEGEDELLPAMADDDYSAQLSWQSQSKDNLKVLMDNFSPAQYERFEAYRRHALPKQAVRKVIQQSLGQQVSQPVAQIVAGFAKVFVGEIVEKARAVQSRRGDAGPLSPDHLREAYRMYQTETGRVGAARPLRSKKLFVK
ncbi:hypothetical protein ONZ45_g16922 [Pleurotus djamor]|nr:hypothetical protein ONZ45_g16922 [Pleurotus djamor]